MQPQHPGQVIFVDGSSGHERQVAISEVPQGLRFVSVAERWVPVVRIVSTVAGEQRLIEAFGAQGELLTSILQFRAAGDKS